MKISEDLPQFTTEKVLLIVTGTFHAELYEVHDGSFEQIESVKGERPEFDDKAGYFETRTRGGVQTSSTAYEDTDDRVRVAFLREFEDALQQTFKKRDLDLIFLFSPEHTLQGVLEKIPHNYREIVKGTFQGDYSSKHPFELLGMIKKLEGERVPEPKSEEARKIYEKTHQDHRK